MEIAIHAAADLSIAIERLEEKKLEQLSILHSQMDETSESLKSSNLVKSALANLISPENRISLLKTTGGLIAESALQRVLSPKKYSILKKVLGAAIGWFAN